jgi:hypothetical protein
MYPLWTTRPPGRLGDGYVNNFRAPGTAPGSTTTRRARTTRRHNATRQCNVCVASASSSSKPEPAPRHRAADAQRRARHNELAEARRQLDEELDLLHQELGMDAESCDRRPAQDVPVLEGPREGNDNRCECRPAADHPHDRAPTPPARGPACDNNRRTKEGANVNTNADVDAPPLFRRASQNLAAAAMLLHGCLEAATSEECRVRQQLKALLEAAAAQQAESSASRLRSERGRAGTPSAHGLNPPPSQHRERREGGGAGKSAVRGRLGPNFDERNTIKA